MRPLDRSMYRLWLLFSLCAIVALFILLERSESAAADARRELIRATAVQDSLRQIDSTRYAIQTMEVSRLRVENTDLESTLESYRAKVRGQLALIATYRARLTDIETQPAAPDTALLPSSKGNPGDVQTIPAREFGRWVVPGEFYLAGRFLTAAPFTFTLLDARLHIAPEVLIGQDERGVWTAAIDSRSPYLTIDDVSVSVVERETSWADLRPRVDLLVSQGYRGWMLGLQASVRVWRVRPMTIISNRAAGVGALVRIYGDEQ